MSRNQSPKRPLSAFIMTLALLGACGGGEEDATSGTITGPNGNNATHDFGEVPLHNMMWEQFSGLGNDRGIEYFLYTLTDEGRAAGESLGALFENETADFQGTIEHLVAGNMQITVTCTPSRPGKVEATLLVRAHPSGSEHRTKLRCEGITDYAFLKTSALERDRCFEDDGLLFEEYDPNPHWMRYDSATAGISTLSHLGHCGRRNPSITLTDEEQRGRSVIGVSPSGDAMVLANIGGIFYKDSNGFRSIDPWGKPMQSARVYAFREDGSFIASAIGMGVGSTERPQANWIVYDPQSDQSTPFIPSAIGESISPAATDVTFDATATRFLWAHGYMGAYQMSFVDLGANKATRLFENAVSHVKSLTDKWTQPIVIANQRPFLSADASQAGIILDNFQGTDYWFKEGNAYVHDFNEGATYAVAVLPDGNLITGDGWGFGHTIQVRADGQAVVLHVYYSAGSGGGGVLLRFDLLVPKRLWKKL